MFNFHSSNASLNNLAIISRGQNYKKKLERLQLSEKKYKLYLKTSQIFLCIPSQNR
jgi:hypothetical protein